MRSSGKMPVGLDEYIELIERTRELQHYEIAKVAIKPVLKKIDNARAVLFDVYGTLITTKVVDLGDSTKTGELEVTFKEVIKEFGFGGCLKKIKPGQAPEKTLKEIFTESIRKDHEEKMQQGIDYPEVILEKIWESIISYLIENGFKYNDKYYGNLEELALKVTFFHDFSWQYADFYPSGANTLFELRKRGIELGIVSNAHRFTSYDIIRQLNLQTDKKIHKLEEIFNKKLIAFSYEVGESKPGSALIRKAIKACKKININEEQIIVVGNDVLKDLWVAKNENRFINTVLFAGDRNSLRLRRDDERLKGFEPDIIITELNQLLKIV